MIKKLFTILLLLGFWGLFPASVFASFGFNTDQTTINPDQVLNLQIQLSLQGQANKIYYLEGGFKSASSSTHFGLTQTDSGWTPYTSSNSQNLVKITTDTQGQWNGSLQVRLDQNSSLYHGPGNYTLEVGRFTETGSSISWSDNNINLSVSDLASPTPNPSSSPSSTASPTNQPTNPPSSNQGLTISNLPSTLDASQSFKSNIQLIGVQPNATYYIKGAFVNDGSTNYFGLTNVNDSWVKNSQSYSSQQSITTDSSGNWQGNLSSMVDTTDSGFSGSGDYIYKVGYYNSSGSGPNWSNTVNINISYTPTPAPTSPDPTSTSTPTETPSSTYSDNTTETNQTDNLPLDLQQNISTVAGEATQSAQPLEQTGLISDPPSGPNWPLIIAGAVLGILSLIPLLGKFVLGRWPNIRPKINIHPFDKLSNH